MHSLFQRSSSITGSVIGAAISVHKHFGPGLLESIYVKTLAHELALSGHNVEQEKSIKINYKGFEFEERLRIDLLIDECLIIEAKVSDKAIRPEHRHQLVSYMSVLDVPLGLIFNFGETRFGERGIQRVILKGADGVDI